VTGPPPTPLGRGSEFDVIRRILARNTATGGAEGVVLGPGDDCAIISSDGGICISVDMSVENVHFRRDWLDPEEIGYRAVTAALSDLAAMAAAPIGVLVALASPRQDDADPLIERIMRGAGQACADADAALLGGDLTRTYGALVVDVVVIGSSRQPALRRGARPGDEVWVTGRLGAAAAAVRSWRAGSTPGPDARHAFVHPVARMSRGLITALIDISDGIAGDADHIAAASRVQIVLDAVRIPVHAAARAVAADDDDALALALRGGEDYELCFTAPPGAVEAAAAAFALEFGLELTRVGKVAAGTGTLLRTSDGSEHDVAGGFDHFDPERTR
jgi:thiamine-monophosphate kinase